MAHWKKLETVRPEDPSTWRDCSFLTLDIDWAEDRVLEATMDLIDGYGVSATWFVTHDTPLLARLRESGRYELGIHPNFNPLLFHGDAKFGATPEEIVARLLAVVPEAKSVRSHSMAQSSWLLNLFARMGLTHDANTFVPHQSGVELKPWLAWNGLVQVPYFWEDDLHAFARPDWRPDAIAAHPGLKVFDFHPIHLFVNTPTPEFYEALRPQIGDPQALEQRRHVGPGPRTFLDDLMKLEGRRP